MAGGMAGKVQWHHNFFTVTSVTDCLLSELAKTGSAKCNVRRFMMVPYSYLTWSPPHLSDEEELALGRQIAIQGREHFVAEFRKSIGKPKGQPEPPPATPLRIFIAIIFVVGGLWFIASVGMFPQVAVLIVIITGIYLVSMHFATRKFEKWIDQLVAKYAAHVARIGK